MAVSNEYKRDVSIKCNWVAGYAKPEVNKGLRAISYSRKMYNNNSIGTGTGEYEIRGEVVWLKIKSPYLDRLPFVWVRESDINMAANTQNEPPKKTNWLWWIAAGMALLN